MSTTKIVKHGDTIVIIDANKSVEIKARKQMPISLKELFSADV